MTVWIITGTSSGFGSGSVKQALARGDTVIATAPRVSKIVRLKDAEAAILALNVTAFQDKLNEKNVKAIKIYGQVDILVNNAADSQFGTVEDIACVLIHTHKFRSLQTISSSATYCGES